MANHKTGDGTTAKRSAWQFSGDVARNFDTHVEKSIPYYTEGHGLVCQLTDYFVRPDSVVYELGCSTGELTLRMADHNREAKPAARFVGIDVQPDMVAIANDKKAAGDHPRAEFLVGDILDHDYEPCDMVVLYYTAQFVPPRTRQVLFNRVYERLNWGGALVMFEKVRGADARFQDILAGLYHDYKLSRGYNNEELAAKSISLRGVLEPFSTAGNLEMLQRAGFVDIESIFRYICFQGFLAIK